VCFRKVTYFCLASPKQCLYIVRTQYSTQFQTRVQSHSTSSFLSQKTNTLESYRKIVNWVSSSSVEKTYLSSRRRCVSSGNTMGWEREWEWRREKKEKILGISCRAQGWQDPQYQIWCLPAMAPSRDPSRAHRGTTLCRIVPFTGTSHSAEWFGFPGPREPGNAIIYSGRSSRTTLMVFYWLYSA
jgi:hypothetical protein